METSRLDLTAERTLSMEMGKLVPILLEEILPGDEFNVKTDMLVRMAPMLAPMMHRVNVYTHYFFVPSRLLWNASVTDSWEAFITGGPDGLNAAVHPTIAAPASTGFALNSLADYLGCPTGVADFVVQALPFRAYAEIFNQWYRDQNLVNPVTVSKAGGTDTTTNTTLLDRAWEKDRFTSALPWAQRGDPVNLPLTGVAPVELVPHTENTDPMKVKIANSGATPGASALSNDGVGVIEGAGSADLVIDPNGRLQADLGDTNALTVNALRQVILLQKWLEKNARGGARYIESILEHFKVRSSDARLQRPEYLGGGVSPLTVSEVLQTSATDAGTPLGAMAGHGFSVPGIHAFKKSFEEHGYVIGIMSVLPRTKYQQGSAPIWNKRSKFDYAFPTFAGLGEQAILKKEVYAASADPDGVWGYAPRFQEYRERESTVHGDFKDTLKYWTMARIFTAEPTLSSTFVQSDPTKRILAATDEPALWVQVLNQVQAKRPLPLVAIPGTSGI